MAEFNPVEHLIKLKGKDYLQVMWRLVWFRTEKPTWCIETKLEQLENNHAVFSAKIYDENGVQKSSGYGSEAVKDFADYIEKAETKAVGRAVAMLGYGTQFTGDMDEGNRLLDAPVDRNKGEKSEPEKPKTKINLTSEYVSPKILKALYEKVGSEKFAELMEKHEVPMIDGKYLVPVNTFAKMREEVDFGYQI